jgi:hypothetical protein
LQDLAPTSRAYFQRGNHPGEANMPTPRPATAPHTVIRLGIAVLIAGCARSTAALPPGPAPHPHPPEVSASPANHTRDVSPALAPRVTTDGTLTAVTLTGPDGRQIAGQWSPDRRQWTATEALAYGTTYTWTGQATNPAGQHTPVAGSFSTAAPASQTHATLNLDDGETTGIAAPIIVQFDAPIADKKAVQRSLSVQTSVPTEGSWAWLPDTAEGSRAHWRPKEYWTPGTQVTVTAHLYGVPFGGGAYGAQDLSVHFGIGRSQIVKADAASHQITVMRDGQPAATYPASYGLDSSPDRTTRSGTHVVMEKDPTQRMTSQEFHYDVVEKFAVRLSNNGVVVA